MNTLGKCLLGAGLLGLSLGAQAYQSVYQGTLGKQAITLVIEKTNDYKHGFYFYDRYRTPIRLKRSVNAGRQLFMDELDSAGLPTARLKFYNPDDNAATKPILGTWTAYANARQLPLELRLIADFGHQQVWPAGTASLPQAASTERFYFQIPLADDHDRVKTIEVIDKASGKRVQTLDIGLPGCYSQGIDSVKVRLEGGSTQVLLEANSYCLGKVFEWREAKGQFEALN
ncbi:hypothetical protein JYG36_19295 [Pseudomonas sp. SORT22]|uniref:hypothetical protein n=1 Tax=Pseudomonas sp. SORT22 TaxID=2813842 RepID=UPI001BD17498|nr:hypothetical protein [Pseudomonas sp. SORT22]QVM95241.1 hypothetical protein JYG36_19295 [Pseudomonas sp. SORT22]